MIKALTLTTYLILFTLLNAQTQSLPKSDLVAKIDSKKEIFGITYTNSEYLINGNQYYPSIKHLGDSLCQILKKNQIEEVDIPNGYVSLHINPNAPILVFDSIRSELQSLFFLTVFHKATGFDNAGFILRIAEPLEDKILKLSNNGYYPQISNLNDCNPEDSGEYEFEEEIIPITRPAPPLDILYRIKNNKIQDIENENDLYVIKVQNKKFNINGVSVKSRKILPNIRNIIKNRNYYFVIAMDEFNTYNDYFQCLELVIVATNAERKEYVNEQLLEINANRIQYYENQALRIFPLNIYSYLPSDKRYIEMKNNR